MKRFKKLILISLMTCLLMPVLQAQTTPPVTDVYSNAEIDSLIRSCFRARSRDVKPAVEIEQKFRENFPKARDIEWEIADNVYEVEFEIKSTDYKAFYDTKGNLLMYYYDIRQSALPAIVKSAATGKYPKYRFDSIKKVHQGSEIFYKIEMEHRDLEVDIVVKIDGTVVS